MSFRIKKTHNLLKEGAEQQQSTQTSQTGSLFTSYSPYSSYSSTTSSSLTTSTKTENRPTCGSGNGLSLRPVNSGQPDRL
jgi:hypothetical protein